MESFFKLKPPEEVIEIIQDFEPVGEETVPLTSAIGRVLSQDLTAPEDLPPFLRSTMDGYAVKAQGTFGATESLPALFVVAGEVEMGKASTWVLKAGQASRIPTGGMLPDGADSVVMIEYCDLLDTETLEVSRAVSPLENVIQPGDDFRKGDVYLRRGHRLRPQDVGVMAGLGVLEVPLFRKPRVALISTGNEIVPIDQTPGPGQVRDINRYTLDAFCRRLSAEPVHMGLCPDRFEDLKSMVETALTEADTLWISGGSSVGTRDLTLNVFETLPQFQLLVHGISISPGKPTIIGVSGNQPVIGLPGHVASALVVAEVFMARLLLTLQGEVNGPRMPEVTVEAVLSQNIESAAGREDYVRVKLVKRHGDLMAEPVFGKSGLISTLVDADGLLKIPLNTEGYYQGQQVRVAVFEQCRGVFG